MAVLIDSRIIPTLILISDKKRTKICEDIFRKTRQRAEGQNSPVDCFEGER